MEELREVNDIRLYKGELQASGLYKMIKGDPKTGDHTFWFDGEEMEHLMSLPDNEFEDAFEEQIEVVNNID